MAAGGILHPASAPSPAVAVCSIHCCSHGSQETDEDFDVRWVTYFKKPDTDAWELRKGTNTLVGYGWFLSPKSLMLLCGRVDG